ncbi:TetR/AcrR family transcriptional regulator [Vandammella animalimorsus]|nr:TetR/AcrR family transcriptional regulator [Vandammella animalimorsus]
MTDMSSKMKRSAARRRTQPRSEETRRRIINSALRLMQKVGFHQTNLQEIARGAKVTLGAVQHQFGNRQLLMETVIDEVMAPLAAAGTGWPQDAASLPLDQRAHEFVRLAWQQVYAPPSYVAAWSLFFGCKATPLLKRIDAHQEKIDPLIFAHFVKVFPEIAQRYPRPEDFAAVVFASLRGLAIMRLFTFDEQANERQLEIIAKTIVDAGSTASD